MCAMKETFFVYHDKRGFFLHFGKIQRKRAEYRRIGLRSGFMAVAESDFFVLCRIRSKRLMYSP